jgi:predicted GNAT family acetyltransferase
LGWWDEGDGVAGAFLHTPPRAILLSAMPLPATTALADELAARGWPAAGVNASEGVARAFASAWEERTGAEGEVHGMHRLHRLGRLVAPEPAPRGRARRAAAEDRPLLIDWYAAFGRDVGEPAGDAAPTVDDRLEDQAVTLWELDGAPVSMAARSRIVAQTARIAQVYTPPEHRGRGYGAAVTAAATRAALDAGARDVLLFTDVDNPTTNRLYARLGYRPVEDRLILAFRG